MRLVLAGIPRAIAQRLLLLSAVSAIATLALAAPALASTPAALATAASASQTATQAAGQTVQGAAQTATQAVPAAQPTVQTAADIVGSAARGNARQAASDAGNAVGGAARALPTAPRPAATEAVSQTTRTVVAAADAARPPAGGDRGGSGPPESGADALGTETLRGAQPLATALGGAVDGALRSLGDTLRGVVPLDSLTAPVTALLADAGFAGLTDLTEPLPLGFGRIPSGSARVEEISLAGVLSTTTVAQPPQLAVPPATGASPSGLRVSQSASAQPPAAEAGGRPAGPPSPRKAPAPTAGGAATAGSGGLTFVPFLALLVLAALAAPKLMRRLEAAPALLRPALFACALERPG